MAERIERYLETAGAQVRWKRVRPALERELRTHLEEQTEAYLAEGMTEDAAEAEAVRQMGDAETVGLALDAVHRPKRQTAILLFAGLAIVLGMYLRAEWIGSSYAFALASGLLACGALLGGYYLDYRCLSRYAWYIYGAVLVLGAVCVYQTTFMGPGAPRMLGITVGDTSEYAALLYPAAYALAVYALQGKKGGFWLSLAAVAPFALPFLWDRYVGILPQLLFAVCAAAVLLSAIRAGLFQVKKNCARASFLKNYRDMIRRVFVEDKNGHCAGALLNDLKGNLNLKKLESVRVLQRYDIEGLDDEVYGRVKNLIFCEAPVENLYETDFPMESGETAFAIEYLPGQFDQRADSAEQCVQIVAFKRPKVACARVYVLKGALS